MPTKRVTPGGKRPAKPKGTKVRTAHRSFEDGSIEKNFISGGKKIAKRGVRKMVYRKK